MYCLCYRHFLTSRLRPKYIQGYENLYVCNSCCQKQNYDATGISKTDRLSLICRGPMWSSSRLCENIVIIVWGCVSTCIAYAIDTC